MNETGYSFVETIVSVVIVMVLCSTLIPISYTMKTTLYHQKLEVAAAETAYEGLKHYRYFQQVAGVKTIDDVDYHWLFDGQKICVTFQNTRELRQKCIELAGEIR
ncbi:hypothetical protein FC756_10160 [Lysinibacillus mangiferihumi]|uniref:Type II secretion system protein n=1 Tax=Lysinibacillus mangiferihumi TaxID=1130819 RepID=A0A4U2Z5Y8_9BACI|nr:hypothetical protein [Lysinibacillus mangiferihumi]TKI68860.1 hypothetical protein FC756_10160 [Lysinibacillus mangiferihumi]